MTPDRLAHQPALQTEPPPTACPVIDIVVPVHNEAHILERNIRTLHRHLGSCMPYPWQITIADNASDDGTALVARRLAGELDRVRVVSLDRKGRGRALKAAWSTSEAAVLAYTDADLSTGLDALVPLVAPLVAGHSDVAVGSRLAVGSVVARGPRRELISRAYNVILRTVFAARFTDAQCGFKAVRADVADALLPRIVDDTWFFDTELLLLADHNDLRIHEVAVDWVDDPDSRVDVLTTAVDDLRGVARMALQFLRGGGVLEGSGGRHPQLDDDMGRQAVTFALIGTISTAVSLASYRALRPRLGAHGANVAAVSTTAVANLWANRRYTFRRSDRASRVRDYRRGAAVNLGSLALSSTALAAVGRTRASRRAEVAALIGAWSMAAVARFTLLRAAPRRTARADVGERDTSR